MTPAALHQIAADEFAGRRRAVSAAVAAGQITRADGQAQLLPWAAVLIWAADAAGLPDPFPPDADDGEDAGAHRLHWADAGPTGIAIANELNRAHWAAIIAADRAAPERATKTGTRASNLRALASAWPFQPDQTTRNAHANLALGEREDERIAA